MIFLVFYFVLILIVCIELFKIKVPHPSYPSTRISVQVPSLGIHFSPERCFKIMELLNLFYGTIETCSQPATDNSQAKLAPWSPADLAADCRILVWRVSPWIFVLCTCLWLTSLKVFFLTWNIPNEFHFTGNWQLSCYMAALFPVAFWIISLFIWICKVSKLPEIPKVLYISICNFSFNINISHFIKIFSNSFSKVILIPHFCIDESIREGRCMWTKDKNSVLRRRKISEQEIWKGKTINLKRLPQQQQTLFFLVE